MNVAFTAVMIAALMSGCGYSKKQIREMVDQSVAARPLVVHTKANIKAHRDFENRIKLQTIRALRSHSQNDPHCDCVGK